MGGSGDEILIVKGKRLDGRKLDEIRPVSVTAGVIPSADGSAEFRIGETVAVAAVYGPKKMIPRHLREDTKAYLNVIYNMVSFSTSERNRPGPSRRSREISKVIKDALSKTILLEKYPQAKIDVFIEIINANAGTRTAAINAASVALADAGIEMKDLVTSIAAGKINGKIALDLFQPEDNFGEADLPIAILPRTNEITLLQMDGDLTKKELKEAIALCKKGCQEIYKIQQKALITKFKKDAEHAKENIDKKIKEVNK